ncbi:NifB/NifX family molybdenum-iron cluster-binding protein [Chloroflexota bacterium]
MKIAITATGSTLDAEVEPRFGRCQYFVIVDPETMEFEAMENLSAMEPGGAGIAAAQVIVGKDVKAVLTGNCGPNAYQVLSSAGIQVITGVSGKIKDAIEGFKSGKFQPSSQANVTDHFGTGDTPNIGGGSGTGRGMGMSRGMGRGMGRSMGRGMGFGMTSPAGAAPQLQTLEQELQTLKVQSQEMAQQLEGTQRRIEELEKRTK